MTQQQVPGPAALAQTHGQHTQDGSQAYWASRTHTAVVTSYVALTGSLPARACQSCITELHACPWQLSRHTRAAPPGSALQPGRHGLPHAAARRGRPAAGAHLCLLPVHREEGGVKTVKLEQLAKPPGRVVQAGRPAATVQRDHVAAIPQVGPKLRRAAGVREPSAHAAGRMNAVRASAVPRAVLGRCRKASHPPHPPAHMLLYKRLTQVALKAQATAPGGPLQSSPDLCSSHLAC
jgi:hypothetical protein